MAACRKAKQRIWRPSPNSIKQLQQIPSHGTIAVSGDFQLRKDFSLDGLLPKTVPDDAAFQITAELPDGSIEPLLWFEHYHAKFAHPFLYRNPIELPAGTKIHGVPPGSTVLLLPLPRLRAAAAYSSSLTGTSKWAVFTTPLRWNCTQMR